MTTNEKLNQQDVTVAKGAVTADEVKAAGFHIKVYSPTATGKSRRIAFDLPVTERYICA